MLLLYYYCYFDIKIWDLRTGSIIDTFSYDNSVTSLQFDTNKIISCAGSNDIKVSYIHIFITIEKGLT